MLDLHTHHYRCGHATGALEDYAREALARELHIIGLSDHAPLFADPEDAPAPGMHMARSAFAEYVEEGLELKRRYQDSLEVLVGVEADYLADAVPAYREALAQAELDYVLGSVHYFDGAHVYDKQRWQPDQEVVQVYRRYFAFVREAAKSGLFDIMAHIDAVKAFSPPLEGDVEDAIDETVEVLRECGVAVEINTSGVRKCGEPFPSPAFIEKLHQAGVPLTFGSDAHRPHEVAYAQREMMQLLEQIGVRELAVYRNRERMMIPLGSS